VYSASQHQDMANLAMLENNKTIVGTGKTTKIATPLVA
jgi:hypothetical protein